MIEKVYSFILSNKLIKQGDMVTVGLSGGADSVALLLVLLELRERLGISVCAAHLNHMLRGAESDADEEYTRKLCDNLGVELTVEKIPVLETANREKIGIEDAARRIRYEFFSRFPGIIATAHTASDNLETVIHHLSRGTGIRGLCGIPAKRGNIVRPLLECTREETEQFCNTHGISFVIDSTNADDHYTRNRIRNRVVPVLKSINPAVESAATRAVELLRCDAEFLDIAAETAAASVFSSKQGSVERFLDLHPAIRSRVLQRSAAALTKQAPQYADILRMQSLIEAGKGCIELEAGIFFKVSNGELFFKTPVKIPNIQFDVEVLEEDFVANSSDKINSLLLKNAIDCDKISGNLKIRSRLPEDKIKLAGRGTKSLKKLFNEARIPLFKRDKLPVVADDNGVVWIYGFGPAEHCRITETTEKIFHLFVREHIN